MSQVSSSQRLRPFKPLRFGRYTLLMPISTGGMGEIYLARLEGAQGFEKLCVIKKILPHLAEDPDFVERFVNEARILVKLSHGNVAQVLDMGVHEGAPYIALEFIDGKDLRRIAARMRDRQMPVPLSFVLYVMIRVLDALAYAHRKRDDHEKDLNLVHRDVSPQNVLISYEGEVKVIDFGLAKSTLSSTRTNPAIILGKFMYMSPEQARHQKVDRRSDLYAVGLCIYELVAGKHAFDDIPPGELMARVASPQITPLSQLEPLCPAALSDAVMRALNPDAALRFQSADEMRAKLQAILLDIDPSAGPETSTRFMREAFAVEYHAERKMLTALREQARQLADEPEAPAATPEPPATLRALPLAEISAAAQASAASPQVPSPSFSFGDLPNVEKLSFQPTPKTGGGAPGSINEEFERETLPSIANPAANPAARSSGPRVSFASVAPAPAPALAFGSAPTEPSSPTPKSLEAVREDLASVLVEGLDKHSLPSPEGRLRTQPEVAAQIPPGEIPPRPAKGAVPKEGQQRRTGRSGLMKAPSVKREKEVRRDASARATLEDPKQNERSTTPLDVPAAQVAAAPKKSGGSVVGWLVIPLLALLAVIGYIAWDVYTEGIRQKQLAEEDARRDALDVPIPFDDRKTREVKVEPTEVLPDTPKLTPDKPPDKVPESKPPDRPKAPKAPSGTAAQKAFQLLLTDYNRIPDETVQQRYKLKVNSLEGEVAKGGTADTLRRINALHAEIKAKLE